MFDKDVLINTHYDSLIVLICCDCLRGWSPVHKDPGGTKLIYYQ